MRFFFAHRPPRRCAGALLLYALVMRTVAYLGVRFLTT